MYCGESVIEKSKVASRPMGVPLNEMKRGVCQKLASLSSRVFSKSSAICCMLAGAPLGARVGILVIFKKDKAGQFRIVKSIVPHMAVRESRKKLMRSGDGVFKKRTIRLPRGDQKAARSLLPLKRGNVSSVTNVDTALNSASKRAWRCEMTLFS